MRANDRAPGLLGGSRRGTIHWQVGFGTGPAGAGKPGQMRTKRTPRVIDVAGSEAQNLIYPPGDLPAAWTTRRPCFDPSTGLDRPERQPVADTDLARTDGTNGEVALQKTHGRYTVV